MKKAIKSTGRILLIFLLLLLLFTLITFLIHRVKTNQEVSLLKEKGYCANIRKLSASAERSGSMERHCDQ